MAAPPGRPRPVRLLFVIRELEIGGAQRQLIELTKGLATLGWEIHIAELYGGGELGRELVSYPTVHRIDLQKKGRWDLVGFLWRLWRTARRIRPDVVHGEMPVGNELALFAGWGAGVPVVWGIRSAGWSTPPAAGDASAILFRLGAWLSPFPDAIISNSSTGKTFHARAGYEPERMHVIPNGIDTARFAPAPGGGTPRGSGGGSPPTYAWSGSWPGSTQ